LLVPESKGAGMALTLSPEQRNAIYELVLTHLTGIGDVWIEIENRDFARAKRLGRAFAEDLRLLDALGWSETIDRERLTLAIAPDELASMELGSTAPRTQLRRGESASLRPCFTERRRSSTTRGRRPFRARPCWPARGWMLAWMSCSSPPSRSSPPDSAQSRKLYVDALGLPLAAAEGSEYWHSEELAGTRHFGIWPLREAAQACFERPEWPAHLSVPQASIEFEVADAAAVVAAAGELEDRGFALLHAPRKEPWPDRRPAAISRRLDRRHIVRPLASRGSRTRVAKNSRPDEDPSAVPRCRERPPAFSCLP
jgi:catechol 2,3-dioxygenase-like lactoylglutathione lyase family enzyme